MKTLAYDLTYLKDTLFSLGPVMVSILNASEQTTHVV